MALRFERPPKRQANIAAQRRNIIGVRLVWCGDHRTEIIRIGGKHRYDRQTNDGVTPMTLLLPDCNQLKERLLTEQPLVVCFCAAWCDTCGIYRTKLAALAETLNDTTFVWADIEDYPELLGEEDVEDFPTILIEASNQVRFFGTMLPHINQLERLLETLATEPNPTSISTLLPDVRQRLLSLAG